MSADPDWLSIQDRRRAVLRARAARHAAREQAWRDSRPIQVIGAVSLAVVTFGVVAHFGGVANAMLFMLVGTLGGGPIVVSLAAVLETAWDAWLDRRIMRGGRSE